VKRRGEKRGGEERGGEEREEKRLGLRKHVKEMRRRRMMMRGEMRGEVFGKMLEECHHTSAEE
jgi:hypothetical protein